MKQISIVAALVFLFISLCISVEAQPTKTNPQLCYLGNRVSSDAQWINEFRDGLRELGHIEGQNITIGYRYWEGRVEQLNEITAELLRLNCDVLLTGGIEAAEAAKKASKTVPVVMVFSGADPVRRGIVASLARPGGNITGLGSIGGQLSGKRLELLKEVIPKLSRVAVLVGPATEPTGWSDAEAAARLLHIAVRPLETKTREDLEVVFKTAVKERIGAIMVHPGGFVGFHAKQIVDLAERHRLPTIYPSLTFSDSGALMIYAEDRSAQFRRAAWYVDRILKGAKPAELPVEQPKKFFLVINVNATKKIGLTILPNVLARADKVIKDAPR
jgi:ABC-type uncharacterized transport system substrate-binding protein